MTDPSAAMLFGDRLPLAVRYAEILGSDGIERGLIGPREADRLWDRHLLHGAVVTELLPVGARVVDVGSGAGLPGLVLAIRRPDLRVELVEPLERRVRFLDEAVGRLGLESQVSVVRGRANDPAVVDAVGSAPYVVARAVAPLDRLVGWVLPLLAPDGSLLAMKGERAAEEIELHAAGIRVLGGGVPELVLCGADLLDEPVRVVVVRRRERE